MRVSRAGLILGGVYAVVAAGLFAVAHLSFADDAPAQVLKGRVIFEQLAVAPAMMLFTYTGLIGPLMRAFPSMNNFYAFFVMSFSIMYLIGWGLSVIAGPDEASAKRPKGFLD
jgi:hypothetical protein